MYILAALLPILTTHMEDAKTIRIGIAEGVSGMKIGAFN
jgi:hypothetical protein